MTDGRVGGLIDMDILMDNMSRRRRWPTDTKASDTGKARDAAAVAEHGKVRSASQILTSLGDPECPSDKPPLGTVVPRSATGTGAIAESVVVEAGRCLPQVGRHGCQDRGRHP